MTHLRITIDESQRQLILMALAHLSVERPGFDNALSEIAALMDNVPDDGRPELYDQFRAMHEGSDEGALKRQNAELRAELNKSATTNYGSGTTG